MYASGYSLLDSHTLSEFEAMSSEEREAAVFPVEHVFREYKRVVLSDFFSRLAHSGLEIYLSKIAISAEEGDRLAIYDKNGFFAIGEVRRFDAGLAVKPIRQF